MAEILRLSSNIGRTNVIGGHICRVLRKMHIRGILNLETKKVGKRYKKIYFLSNEGEKILKRAASIRERLQL